MLGAQRLCGLRVVEIFGFRAVSRTRHICPMLLPHFLREADYKNVIAAFRACLSRSKFHAVGSTSSCIAFHVHQQFRSARYSDSRVLVGGKLGLRSMYRWRATASVSLHFMGFPRS